jgi:hypothetical protein
MIAYQVPFNFSQAWNRAGAQGTGDHILLFNDDVEVTSPDFIGEALSFSQQDDIGAVGAKFCVPDGTLQPAGVIILRGEPGHAFHRFPHDHDGY